jgi:FADH2 O2-dependent halogenase
MSATPVDADLLIIGSGFGGSLAALLAQRIGRTAIVVDARRHPRFAIGESSTPLANLILESLADRYELPWLKPLANYASWKATYPTLGVGLKRGFSYFQHHPGEPFRPDPDRGNELLVAASHGPADADTHWVRAEFDHFLANQVVAAGIPLFESTRLTSLKATSHGWELWGEPDFHATARFILDASGDGGFLRRQLNLGDETADLETWSRGLYGHFTDVMPWETIYRAAGGDSAPHPFAADDAALHHIFPGGWMWNLRFDHGVTSAGFALATPVDTNLTPETEWRQLLDRYPSIGAQYAHAKLIAPDTGLVRTGRMQRLSADIAGPNWALLPTAAGFIDPLHSTGNSHTLIGLERLLTILERDWSRDTQAAALAEYARLTRLELLRIDRIVAGCYRHFADFPRMIAWSLFYFLTAIWSEHRRRTAPREAPPSFLAATDPELTALFDAVRAQLDDPRTPTPRALAAFRDAVEPINLADLGNPARRNLYPYI